MPKPEVYLSGYGLYPGVQLAGFRLNKVQTKHEMITRYREYKYPTTMVWTSEGGNPDILLNTLNQYLLAPRIIYSEYGNSYECVFGQINSIKNNSTDVSFSSTGICRRVYA